MDTTALGLAGFRILIGIGIARHGAFKIFGGGVAGLTEGVAQMGFPLPALFAWAAALSEFLGGLCLAAGVGTRIAAFFIWCTMSIALFIHHAGDPFSAKELAYLYWTASLALMLLGGGRYTVWRMVQRVAHRGEAQL